MNLLPDHKNTECDAVVRLIIKANQYAETDPEAYLTFGRKAAESICRYVFSERIGEVGRTQFDELIKQLCRSGELPARLEQPLVTIQKYGNFGTHNSSPIEVEYIIPSLSALKHLTKWYFLEYLQTAVPSGIEETWYRLRRRLHDPDAGLRITSVQGLFARGWTLEQLISNTMSLDYETLEGLVEDHEGDFDQWVSVVLDHPETVSLLLDESGSIIGYWHFVPLFEKEFRRMKRGLMDIGEVTSDKIPLLGLPGVYDMYFVIIALSARHRYSRAVRLLFESFVDTLEQFAREGVYFREFCTDAYTPTGVGICRSFAMKFLSKNPNRGEIYVRKFFPFPKHALFDKRHDLRDLYAQAFNSSASSPTGTH